MMKSSFCCSCGPLPATIRPEDGITMTNAPRGDVSNAKCSYAKEFLAQSGQMMRVDNILKTELSGVSAKAFVEKLTAFHRIQASVMYHDAVEYVKDEITRIGLDDISVERFVADGKRRYWTHGTTLGWSVNDAELRLVEPEERIIARFRDIPQSLHTYSNRTPEGGVTARLIDVGAGTSNKDYKGKQVKDKIVLATGRAKLVHEHAVVKRGAAGVITDSLTYEFSKFRENVDIPDAHAYQGIWPNATNKNKIRFGFSISKRQGNELRKYLRSGKIVRMHAEVDAKLMPGKYEILTASIKGSEKPDEEILLVSHLCHPKPGANDNASGCGLLMEIARTLMALIMSGKMKRPVRTIRFMWLPETVGSVALLSTHPEIRERLLAGINLDMVGENQELCGSTLCLDCTPDSIPSYLNDLVFSAMRRANDAYDDRVKLGMISNFRYARTPYTGGSDHSEFGESTTGVPCVSVTQWPDKFYHTSMDTMDKVSEDSLRRVGFVAALSVLTVANAGERTAMELAADTCTEGVKRVTDRVRNASGELFAKIEEPKQTKKAGEELARLNRHHRMSIRRITSREASAIRSVSRLCDSESLRDFVDEQVNDIEAHGERESLRLEHIIDTISADKNVMIPKALKETKAEAEARVIIPKRLFKGTIDPDYMSDELGEDFQWYHEIESSDRDFSRKAYDMVNLIDGKRSVQEIMDIVSAEFGPTSHEHALRFMSDLKKIGLVSYRTKT
ncbi:MAG: DUF4910 domain-containing protein, partial [Thermoplasmata archaeon]|nr:DUF4910 domain-containing protein [Thermoplasmata archaeon]